MIIFEGYRILRIWLSMCLKFLTTTAKWCNCTRFNKKILYFKCSCKCFLRKKWGISLIGNIHQLRLAGEQESSCCFKSYKRILPRPAAKVAILKVIWKTCISTKNCKVCKGYECSNWYDAYKDACKNDLDLARNTDNHCYQL